MSTFLIIVAIIIAFVIISKAFKPKEKPIPNEALEMMQDMYADLSKEQKYSIYNLIDTFVECAKADYTKYREAKKIQKMNQLSLNINTNAANQYFQETGVERMISDLKTIQDGAIKDSSLMACLGLVSLANGTLNGNKVQDYAENLFMKVFGEMGYTEEDIENTVNKTQAMMNHFGI